MRDSGYDSNSAVIPHRAAGYTFSNNHFENAGFVHMSVPYGAGALYSTTEDLLKWEQALFGGKVLTAAGSGGRSRTTMRLDSRWTQSADTR